jgi:hypothetical protein
MGMDVIGKSPTSPAGEYFRANIWTWVPIHALIVELCSDQFDEETLMLLGSNDGAGPADQATCTEMANRFERRMEHHVDGHQIESDELRVNAEGRFVDAEENSTQETMSPFMTRDEHLKEWIEFLRHCGGFEVR